MRVIHVASGRLFGGIEQMLVTLARHREVTPDVEPEFAIASRGRLEDDLRSAAAPVQELPGVPLSRPPSGVRARGAFDAIVDHAAAKSGTLPPIVVAHAPW